MRMSISTTNGEIELDIQSKAYTDKDFLKEKEHNKLQWSKQK